MQKRILIAALNWGLGHATRCMPIIQALLDLQHEVILASDGRALDLLRHEYPKLKTIELPSYQVTYKTGNMVRNILPQIPTFLRSIKKEQQVILDLHKKLQFDCLISDNRYGCHHPEVPSVFITHQLEIKTPFAPAQAILNKMNHRLLRPYQQWWVPDYEGEVNLSGDLAHKTAHPKIRFLGALSRMKFEEYPQKYDLLAVLSGPEPQRTYFEETILKQLANTSLKAMIVQGKTDQNSPSKRLGNIEIVSFLTAHKLNKAMLESKVILARSGYSTLMDLATLGKKAILVPTPGQTEQEYLAKRFHQQGVFFSQKQSTLQVEEAYQTAQNFTGLKPQKPSINLPDFLTNFLETNT